MGGRNVAVGRPPGGPIAHSNRQGLCKRNTQIDLLIAFCQHNLLRKGPLFLLLLYSLV